MGANELNAQSEQPAAWTVPEFITLPAYPGAQIVHAETDVPPVDEPVVYIPVGQGLQEDEPEHE